MSMNPGATTLPSASVVFVRGAALRLPIAAIFPSRIPTSPEYQGEPVPSMMWPLVMTRSNSPGDDCAARLAVASIAIATRFLIRHNILEFPFLAQRSEASRRAAERAIIKDYAEVFRSEIRSSHDSIDNTSNDAATCEFGR